MASAYPAGLDSFATNKANATATTTDHPTHHNDLADAVNKIEAVLGVNPNGAGGVDDDYWRTGALSGWTQVNPSGTQTLTVARGRLSVLHDDIVANDIGAIVKPLTGEAVGSTLVTDVRHMAFNDNFTMGGLVFSDGAAVGSNVAAIFYYLQAGGNFIIESRGGVFQTVGATVQAGPVLHPLIVGTNIYIRWIWQAANTFRAEFSPDGVTWTTFGMADSGITLAPTHGGVFWSGWGATTARITSFGPFLHDAP